MKAHDAVLARALSDRALGLILMPTEACNFRCTYCYEDFAHGRMRSAVVNGVKRLLTARAAGLAELHISWFGGEPLLAQDIVLEVQEHARELERAHRGLRCSADMTTNAYGLSPALFERLIDLGVNRYHISLDGPREQHDLRRRRANGRGTFDRIWEHLVAMGGSERSFRTTLRLHVDRENLESHYELVDAIRAAFGADPRFSIYLRPLSRYGGPNDARMPLLEGPEDARRFAELRRYAYGEAAASPSPGQPGASASSAGNDSICYAAQGNRYVVRADGRLCKCTVALGDPANTVGRLREDGTVEIDPARARPWMRGLFSGSEAELACPLIGLGLGA